MLTRVLILLFSFAIAVTAGCQTLGLFLLAPGLVDLNSAIGFFWPVFIIFIGLPLAALIGYVVGKSIYRLLHRICHETPVRFVHLAALVALLLVGETVVSWYMLTFGDVKPRWSEQVAMADGTRVLIVRTASGNVLGKSKERPDDWWPSEYSVDISGVATSPGTRPWRSALRPLLLDRDASSGKWYLIAEPLGCNAWTAMGRPAPPYYQYTLESTGWTRGQMPSTLIGRRPNLLLWPNFTGELEPVTPESARSRNDFVPADLRPIIRATSGCS